MKNLMKGFGWMMVYGVSVAYAAPQDGGEGAGWLSYLFVGFFTLIIISQLVPACLLFIGMVRGIFSAREDKEAAGSPVE